MKTNREYKNRRMMNNIEDLRLQMTAFKRSYAEGGGNIE